jgi:hypothetical protein
MMADWIVAVIATLAFILSVYTIREQRKAEQRRIRERQEDRQPQVKIVTQQTLDPMARNYDVPVYSCIVTNTGIVGVTISSVVLEHAEGGGVGIALQLVESEEPRRLDSGESQTWGIYMHEIKVQGPAEIPVVAVATDITGTEHRSKPENTLALRGSD